MNRLTIRQFAAVKRVAQNVSPLVIKRAKIMAKISELQNEYENLGMEIEGHEMGIRNLTGGYTCENLVSRKVVDSGKVDANGKPIMVTKYEPNPEYLRFDEEDNSYIIEDVNKPMGESENILTSSVEGDLVGGWESER